MSQTRIEKEQEHQKIFSFWGNIHGVYKRLKSSQVSHKQFKVVYELWNFDFDKSTLSTA